LIVVLLNTLALAGAGGMLVYTKVLFKRPPITEEAERERLLALHEKAHAPMIPGVVMFDSFTANIEPAPVRPEAVDANGQQIRGRLHYATMSFALELRDTNRASEIEDLRPRIMDAVLGVMGHKNFNELSSAQGRYMLRTEIVETINRLVAHYEAPDSAPPPKEGTKPASEGGATAPVPEGKATDEEALSYGESNYSVREGLVTNVYLSQFVVQ
jgi:flagellar basal body-associated protein FliL